MRLNGTVLLELRHQWTSSNIKTTHLLCVKTELNCQVAVVRDGDVKVWD
jgi:hypothetical protein